MDGPQLSEGEREEGAGEGEEKEVNETTKPTLEKARKGEKARNSVQQQLKADQDESAPSTVNPECERRTVLTPHLIFI